MLSEQQFNQKLDQIFSQYKLTNNERKTAFEHYCSTNSFATFVFNLIVAKNGQLPFNSMEEVQ